MHGNSAGRSAFARYSCRLSFRVDDTQGGAWNNGGCEHLNVIALENPPEERLASGTQYIMVL